MPSSGYGAVDLIRTETNTPEGQAEHMRRHRMIVDCAEVAMRAGLFVEWLESFVAAHQKGADVCAAAQAGLIEWDL